MRRELTRDRRPRFGVEALEARLLLNADVRVRLDGDDLKIKGRGDGLCVEISQVDDEVTVASCGENTINGGDEFVTSDFDGDIKIKLRGAGNEVTITDVDVPDGVDVVLRGRAGGHSLILENVTIGEDLEAYLGAAEDGDASFVGLDTVDIDDDLSIETGDEGAEIGLVDVNVGDDASIETGDGEDLVEAAGVNVGGETEVETNGGIDEILVEDSEFDEEVEVDLGRGDDSVCTSGSTFADDLEIEGGRGDDVAGDDGSSEFGEEPEMEDVEEFDELCGGEEVPE